MRLKIPAFICVLTIGYICLNCSKDKDLVEDEFIIDPSYRVVTTNQASNRIEIYNPSIKDWNSSGALEWSWYPNNTNGFSEPINGWRLPTDAKLRNNQLFGGKVMIVTAYGFCAIITYPAGEKIWSQEITGNLHSAELLPDGNVAIAASDGNWIRVYASSQGDQNSNYTQYNLNSAHGVQWDSEKEVLWVLGQDPVSSAHILTALKVQGTADQPDIKEITSSRSILPTSWGHDLSPYYGDTRKLWISTNSGVYIYNKEDKTFSSASASSNRKFVKTVSNFPSGIIVETQPDSNKNPKPLITTTLNDWGTSTVDFYSDKGIPAISFSVNGACFYKARVLSFSYQ